MPAFLRHDRVFLLLFLNALLVIVGYALALATGGASLGLMKIAKTFSLFLGLFWIFLQKDFRIALRAAKNISLVIFLCLILPGFALISDDFQFSLNRTQTFLLPLVYVWLSINILVYRYGQKEVLTLLSQLVIWVYVIPIISYVFFGGGFSGTSIYGYNEEMVFISNHFGWSASLFLIASFSYLNKRKIKFYQKLQFYPLIALAGYLLIVSGTRSAILSVTIALVVILFNYRGVPTYQKILIVISPILLVSYLYIQGNEAVLFVVERTQQQRKAGTEGRLERFEIVTDELQEKPLLWFTGVGLFNYRYFDTRSERFSGYHNSYFDLLFGLGIPLFLLFMVFMVYEPVKQLVRRVSAYDLVFIPVAIIPFFESNLTAGQFLFFPWFCYIFALNTKQRFAFYGKRNRPAYHYPIPS